MIREAQPIDFQQQLSPNEVKELARKVAGLSPNIWNQAAQIAAANRPVGIEPGSEPVCMAGLTPQDHGILNRGVSSEEIEQYRKKYAGDRIAQQQLDVYDPNTEYHIKIRQLRDAVKKGDDQKENELVAWFMRHYPDIHLPFTD